MHLIDLQVKQKGMIETRIPWLWQVKESLQMPCLCRAPASPSGLGEAWFVQALRQQEAAASVNHPLGQQPRPTEGREAVGGLKQVGSLQHRVAELQDDLLPQTARRGLAAPCALQGGTLSTPPASSSWPPPSAALPACPEVPGGDCFGGRLPAKDLH